MKVSTSLLKEEALVLPIDDSTAWCKALVMQAYRHINVDHTAIPLSGTLRLQKTLDQVDLSGALDFTVTVACNRCLDPFPHTIHLPLRVTFIPKGIIAHAESGDFAGDLGDDDVNVWPYSGEEIDLGAIIHELAVLSIPLQFLCDEACKGLCPRCGANQNREGCACDKKAIDPRLAALAQFKVKPH